MSIEQDLARERELADRAREAARTLIETAGALRWYTDDPVSAAMAWVQATALQEGYEPCAPAPTSKRKTMPHRIARKVFDRDDWTCQRCGTHRNLTVDHKTPVSKGGTDDIENLQTLCGSCNSSKGARD